MSWHLNHLSIAQSVIYFDHATDIWSDLKEHFSQSDLLRIAELQEEVYAFKQGSQSITNYFVSLKSLWEELDNYPPMGPYTCSAKSYHQQDFIIHFLKGLDERFVVVRSQVLLLEPLPFVNRVFSMVIQHERQLLQSTSFLEDHKILSNSANAHHPAGGRGRGAANGGGGRGTSNKACTYCGQTGHTVEICYAKHGYPSGHPCYPGCPRFHDWNVAAVTMNNSVVAEKEDAPRDISRSGSKLTQDQYQSLLALLQPITNSGPLDSPKSS